MIAEANVICVIWKYREPSQVRIFGGRANIESLFEGTNYYVSTYVVAEVRHFLSERLVLRVRSLGGVSAVGASRGREDLGEGVPDSGELTRRLPSGVEQTTVLDPIGTDPKAREFLLEDGDILLVPVGNTFYVLGEVLKPGAYQID